jgi:hypothetical protein
MAINKDISLQYTYEQVLDINKSMFNDPMDRNRSSVPMSTDTSISSNVNRQAESRIMPMDDTTGGGGGSYVPTTFTPTQETEVPTMDNKTGVTSVNEIPFFSASKLGQLQYSKYLYESGLQNIFNDYQTNVQRLEQQEKESLQQAYYLKEISKKYLGEYASNVGIGNVSGNLLDIYSQYASNIANIDKEFTNLELNLNREYMLERMKTFNDILETQFEITREQFNETAVSVAETAFSDFDRDVLGGLAYIESQKENLDPVQFEQIKESYYRANLQSVLEAINSENPYYGFTDLENKTLRTQEEFLQDAKQWISEKDWQRVQEQVALQELRASNEGNVSFNPVIFNSASMYTNDPLVSDSSRVFELRDGEQVFKYAVATQPISTDDIADTQGATNEALLEQFEKQSGRSRNDISEGDIVKFGISNYIVSNGEFVRMVQLIDPGFENITASDLSTWNINNTSGVSFGGVQIDFNYGPNKFDAVTFNGKTYVEDGSVGKYSKFISKDVPGTNIPMNEVITYLNQTFGTDGFFPKSSKPKPVNPTKVSSTEIRSEIPKGQIFYYKGQFFVYTEDGKKIRPLVLEK